MECPEGYIALKEGAVMKSDGCLPCKIGTYSSGGNETECLTQECPSGQYPVKVGAVSAIDGCNYVYTMNQVDKVSGTLLFIFSLLVFVLLMI